jgi:lysophospholipase L1-like esterase
MGMTRATGWRANAIFGLLVTLVFYGTAEVVCRWLESGSKYQPSEFTVYELVPGYDGGDETVNRHGLRGAEIEVPKTGARILAMGGSSTWGHVLDDDETWPYLLGEALRERGEPVTVLNGGVSGWGLEQIERMLTQRHLDALDPDLVVVYSGWNEPRIQWNPMAHSFRMKNASSEEKYWIFRSALVRRIARRIERTSRRLKLIPDRPPAEGPDGQPNHLDSIQQSYPALLASIARACRERGIELVVVLYPGLTDLPTLPTDSFRERFAEKYQGDGRAPDALDEAVANGRAGKEAVLAAIEEAAQRNGIATLDVAARMRTDLGSTGIEGRERWTGYFRDPVHLTAEGNEAVARAMAAMLVERNLW